MPQCSVPWPLPAWSLLGRVSHTQECTCRSPSACQSQRHTHLPAGGRTKCTHTHKCVLREMPMPPPLPLWGQLPSGTPRVALGSKGRGAVCPLLAPSVFAPIPPHLLPRLYPGETSICAWRELLPPPRPLPGVLVSGRPCPLPASGLSQSALCPPAAWSLLPE